MNNKNLRTVRNANGMWRRCGGFAINTCTIALGVSAMVAIGIVPSISSVTDDEVDGCVPQKGALMNANARLEMLENQIAQVSEGKAVEDC